MALGEMLVDRLGTPRGMLALVAIAWVAAGAAITGTQIALSRVSTQQATTNGVVERLKRAESEASVNRVLASDQRCAFSAKSTAAHAATVAEFNEIIEFVDRAGVPRSATIGLRRRARDKADRVAALVADVAECQRTRNRYFAQLTKHEREAYESRRVERPTPSTP